ncbi:MAG: ribosome hibernation-promoting factor, HPF/YfiA family [Acidimicrobiales bacterium]
MDVSISSRHVNVTPRLEEVVREKIGELDRFLEGLDTAEVHFAEARNPRISDKETCEVTLSGRGHHLRCKVSAPDPYTAIDRAEAKLESQIRKLRTRLQRRHQGRGDTIRTDGSVTGPFGAGDVVDPDGGADHDGTPRIVKTKRFHLGPLTPDDAAVKMDLLGHGFFFFINKDTGRSAVVYRRDDGDVGLIDEAG